MECRTGRPRSRPIRLPVTRRHGSWRSDGLAQLLLAGYQPPVDVEIVLGHAADGETFVEDAPDPRAVELVESPRRCRRLRLIIDDEAGDAVVDDLRHRA